MPLKVVLVLGGTFIWVSAPPLQLLGSPQPVGPTLAIGVVLDMVVLGLLAYTWLPVPSATLLWSTLRRGPADHDLPPLTGFTIILTAYLSVFGRQVRREHAGYQRWQILAFRDP